MATNLFPINPAGLAVGDRVWFRCYGGEVTLEMSSEHGTVTRLNRTGHPVIEVILHSEPRIITDRHGAAWRIGERPPLPDGTP